MDLDNEELEATRKLHGLDKKKNGNDTNVGSIEDYISRLKKIIKKCDECKFATCEQCEICWRDVQAIKIVLKNLDALCDMQRSADRELKNTRKINEEHQKENEQKDKIIDEIQKEVRDHIGFENRLKRDNREPDLFNQGRFYVANNINNIMKGK